MNSTVVTRLGNLDGERLKGYKSLLDFYYGRQWEGKGRRSERRLTFNYAKVFIEKITSYLMAGVTFAVDPASPTEKAIENARRAEAARDVHGAWKLIGLHSHQGDHATTAAASDPPRNTLRVDAGIGLVDGGDIDDDVIAQHAALVAVQSQAIQHRQSIGRNRRTQPLNDVSVVVVVRWLDQDQGETLWGLLSRHNITPRRAAERYFDLLSLRKYSATASA